MKTVKICCLQMDMILGKTEENFRHAEQMIRDAMENEPDVIVLPETWNTGFFPVVGLKEMCRGQRELAQARIGSLARKFHVNIVAGSVSDLRDGHVFNTALVFDREGKQVAVYDKTHLFSPMGENVFYTPGERLCSFRLDDIPCGLIICYDVRFPELTRKLALDGAEMLFMVSQWPQQRVPHLRGLTVARAIENQMAVVCCNSCGKAGETVYGGNSAVIDPLGQTLALADDGEMILCAEYDPESVRSIRQGIPVFRDRRPELY